MKTKLFLLVTIWVLTCHQVGAQRDMTLINEYEKIYKAYREVPRLSFDIKYLYSRQNSPSVVDDSSMVSFKLDGNRYLGVMENMEFMQSDSFALVVYPSERIFTLGKPVTGIGSALPMAQWDSLLAKGDFIYSMDSEEGNKKITIDYKSQSQVPIKKLEIWYDPVNYFIQRVRYVMNETSRGMGNDSGEAIIVSIMFSNYQSGSFSDAVFNSGKYFTRSGDQYIPVNHYRGFEVFVVSPGL